MARLLKPLYVFFGGWRFPVFALTLITGYELVLLGLLLLPAGEGQMASFADEFRVWCFRYDPATGGMEWAAVVTTFTSPLILMLVAATVWIQPLREVTRRRPGAMIPWATAAAVIVISSTFFLTSLDVPQRDGELPFPAERLRTERIAPPFRLVDQDGETVELQDFRGRVVLLTAIYSRCGFTCPMLMGQAKRVVEQLQNSVGEAALRDLAVVGITLDPEHDTPTVLAQMAAGQQVSTPLFHLCTGAPDVVEALLDRLDVARKKDAETGVIDHANLFLLIDRGGRIAYRLTLGDRQEQWLLSALRILLREDRTE